MELTSLRNTLKNTIYPNRNHFVKRDIPFYDIAKSGSIYDYLAEEAGEEAFHYFERFSVTDDPNIILLSAVRHYIYTSVEFKKVKTLINLKHLNQIQEVNNFLNTTNRVLPLKCNFVGCFIDNRSLKTKIKLKYPIIIKHLALLYFNFEKIFLPRIPLLNWVQFKFNQKKLKSLSSKQVTKILNENGFHVIDMTEIKGLTYFISQKVSHTKNENTTILKFINELNTPYY